MSKWAEAAIARRPTVALWAGQAAPRVGHHKTDGLFAALAPETDAIRHPPSQPAHRPARGPVRSKQPRRPVVGPVHFGSRTFVPGQGNNLYIFPAVGMAVLATEAKRVTEAMFIRAAKAVAEEVSQAQLDSGLLYPPQSQILETSLHVAVKVAAWIFDQGLARIPRPADIEAPVRQRAYRPEYPTYA